jgi:hypothetical protein
MRNPAKNRAANERGVYIAPWVGSNGEFVLIAISRTGQLVGEPATIPLGYDHVLAGDELWERLDAKDPAPQLVIVR